MRSKSMTPEERHLRKVRARRRFKALVRQVIANLDWLVDVDDDTLGDNVMKNIQVLTRKKGQKGLLSFRDKVLFSQPQELRTEDDLYQLNRVVGRLHCFRRYPADVKKQLPKIMYFCYYGPDRILMKQSREAINVYIIATGQISVSITFWDKLLKEIVTKEVAVLGPGTLVGEVSLLHGIPRTATIKTITPCEFLYIKREDFDIVVKQTVLHAWEKCRRHMARFDYFDGWNDVNIRESCILHRRESFREDQIVLGKAVGQHDYAYFVLKGYCYVVEKINIQAYYRNGIKYHRLIESEEKIVTPHKIFGGDSIAEDDAHRMQYEVVVDPTKNLKNIEDKRKSISSKRKSTASVCSIAETKRAISLHESCITLSRSSAVFEPPKIHFVRICTYSKLACFNVGENINNRFVIAGPATECLLLPHYFLREKASNTFRFVQEFLDRSIPTTKDIFLNFLEEIKWKRYKEKLLDEVMGENPRSSGNSMNNVPYSIRLRDDLAFRDIFVKSCTHDI